MPGIFSFFSRKHSDSKSQGQDKPKRLSDIKMTPPKIVAEEKRWPVVKYRIALQKQGLEADIDKAEFEAALSTNDLPRIQTTRHKVAEAWKEMDKLIKGMQAQGGTPLPIWVELCAELEACLKSAEDSA